MAGGTPPRHGVDQSTQVGHPYPSAAAHRTPLTPTQLGQAQTQVTIGGMPMVGRIPIVDADAFFNALPSAMVQQIAKALEAYNSSSVYWDDANNAPVPEARLTLASFSVPQQYVYIFTDIMFYALCPSRHLEGPPIALTGFQLSGTCHFELQFGGVTPLRVDGTSVSAQATPGQTSAEYTTTPAVNSGWASLDTPIGAQRTTGFAVYARSGQIIEVIVHLENRPRFFIQKFGAQLHGFTVPESLFDGIFAKRRG